MTSPANSAQIQSKIEQVKELKKQKVMLTKKLIENEDFKNRLSVNKQLKTLMNEIIGETKDESKSEPKSKPKSEPKKVSRPKKAKKEPYVDGLQLK